jgi:hypothetical protein
MVASKAPLIKMALGVDELPIDRGETEITFLWFRPGRSHEEVHSYTQFITQLCKTVKNKKRVTATVQEFANLGQFSGLVNHPLHGRNGIFPSTARFM